MYKGPYLSELGAIRALSVALGGRGWSGGEVWSLWRLSWKLPKSRLLWIWVNTHRERLEAELQKLELLKAESLERRASRGTVTLKWVPGEEAAPTP